MVEAWRNSPALAAQRADIKVASEFAVQARAGGRVNAAIDGSTGIATRNFDRRNAVFPNSLSLTVTQPLYTGGQVENQTEAAETRITAEEAVLVATEQQVLLDAVTAFSDVRRDEFLLDVARNNVRVLTEQLRAAGERFEVGEVTRTDVEQARARLAAAQSRLAAADGQLKISRENFANVVGRLPQDLDPPPPLPDLPATLDAAAQVAAQNDPLVQAARIERVASGFDVRAAIGLLLPQLALEGRVSQLDTFNDRLDGQRSGTVALNLRIPLYAGGFNYSRVRQAQATVESAEAAITDALRSALREVGVAWSSLAVAQASILSGRLEVRAAQLAFEGVTEEAKVGARTTLDVLDAEEEVLQARGRLITSQRDEYVAAYRLLAAMGKLTVAHLGLDVAATAGVPYYETVRDRNFGYDDSDETVWALPYRP
jgi:outer membrane protein